MTQVEYEEFDLQLDKAGDGYTVRVLQSPIGPTGPESFQLPGNAESLKLLVLTLRAVRGVRSLESDTAPDAKKYGGELFDAVFHDEILSALRGSLHVASTTNRGLRVRLRFTDPSVLANIPWELLYDTSRHRFLSQYGKYPVVRYIDIPEPVTPLKVSGPVRMLVVISAPRDYPEIDTEREWDRLLSVLKPFVDTGRLQVDRLPTASLAAIHRALLEDEYHVFHYIGHGGVDPRSGDGVLALTGPDGLSRLESGHDVGVMLSNSPIRLAVLNSCEGARISDVDPYAGTAISFVQQGIPAVVAMQFEISDEAAFAFSSTLYDGITEGRPIDLAVTLARQAILATSRSEWATPVLYLRASDGVIFDITSMPAPKPIPPTVLAEPPPPVEAKVAEEATSGPPPASLAKPPAGPPAAPTGLAGTVVGRHDVDLRWEVPETGRLAVSWEVLRDGVMTVASAAPGATDAIPGPGTYTYTVVAIDEDGGRSPASEPCTVVVEAPGYQTQAQPVPAPTGPKTAETQPLPASGAPLVSEPGPVPGAILAPSAPHMVGATVRRGAVQLAWTQDETPSAPVAHWLLTRDGQPIERVEGEPRADDDHPGNGKHVYAVTAVGRGGGRSDPSDELEVSVGGGSRVWLALLLIPLLAGLAWFLFLRDTEGGGPPSTPTGLVARVAGLNVTLTWADPTGGSPTVEEWRVLRGGAEVGRSDKNSYTDPVPKAGKYTYTVVAVGEGGLESPASAPTTATATTIPTTIPTTPVTPPTTSVTASRANLSVRFPDPSQATNGSEQIDLRVYNAGPDRAETVEVTVRSLAPGGLERVTMGANTVPCTQNGDTAVCRVARINANRNLAMIVHVDLSRAPFHLSVRAESAVEDPSGVDNSALLNVEPGPTTTRPTVTVLEPSLLTVTP